KIKFYDFSLDRRTIGCPRNYVPEIMQNMVWLSFSAFVPIVFLVAKQIEISAELEEEQNV
ncbi:MAG: hypothetical protein V3V39_00805, partial [Desulfobacterales bacterium]